MINNFKTYLAFKDEYKTLKNHLMSSKYMKFYFLNLLEINIREIKYSKLYNDF